MEDLAERFPPGLEYVTPYDTTLFIDASVETVLKTFIEAFLIVIVILFIFLQTGALPSSPCRWCRSR